MCISAYVFTISICKLSFFDALQKWMEERYQPEDDMMLLGDINIAPRPCDVYWNVKENPELVSHHPHECERFDRLLEWGLEDLGQRLLSPGAFTFHDYRTFWDFRARRYRYDLGLRIDHFLATKSLSQRAQSMEVLKTWRHKKKGLKPSDHVPLRLILQEDISWASSLPVQFEVFPWLPRQLQVPYTPRAVPKFFWLVLLAMHWHLL